MVRVAKATFDATLMDTSIFRNRLEVLINAFLDSDNLFQETPISLLELENVSCNYEKIVPQALELKQLIYDQLRELGYNVIMKIGTEHNGIAYTHSPRIMSPLLPFVVLDYTFHRGMNKQAKVLVDVKVHDPHGFLERPEKVIQFPEMSDHVMESVGFHPDDYYEDLERRMA